MSTFSSDLKIELIGTGEQSGVWGTTTNSNFSNVFEQALVGRVSVPFTDANVTLTATDSVTSQSFRRLYLNCTGANTATRNLVVPTINKTYVVQNNTTGNQSILVKTSAGTGITVPNGKTVAVYVDGTNVIQSFDYIPTLDIGTVNVTTIDTTNIEVTNIKAKDGTASASIADSTGVFTHATTTVFPAGAVGTPSITTTGDTNTGIFFPAADTIAFTEGGAEAMRIDSSGNVGIGTSSPGTTLQVTANATVNQSLRYNLRLFDASSTAAGVGSGVSFGYKYDGTNYLDAAGINVLKENGTSGNYSSAMTFSTRVDGGNLTERMRIDSSGNVGIGTSSPNYRLDVAGNQNSVAAGITTAYGVASEVYSSFRFNNSSFSGGSSEIRNIVNGASTIGSNLAFFTSQAGTGTLTERLRIDISGNVGIGTSSPNFSNGGGKYLDVNGGASRGNISLLTDATNADGTLMGVVIFGATTQSANHQVPAQIFGELEGATANQRGGRLSFYTKANASTVLTERMRINSGGNVGIGTSSPSTFLTVSGTNTASRGQISVVGAGVDPRQTFYSDSTFTGAMEFGTALAYMGSVANVPFAFYTNNTERMRINSSGNVGIGTTNPGFKLDITDATTSQDSGGIRLTLGSEARSHLITNTTPNASAGRDLGVLAWRDLLLKAGQGTTEGVIRVNSYEYTTFGTGSSYTERMRIDSSGNVLVGDTSADYSASGRGNIEINGSSTSILALKIGAAPASYFYASASDLSIVNTLNGLIGFYTNSTEKARITSGGNLSVGTTSSLGRLGIQAATANNTDYGIYIQDSAAALMFYIRNDGVIQTGTKAASPYNNTTATAANMVVDNAGTLLRSTSSIKYKTQVENLDSSHADAILNFRPVWYRSLCNADNKNWSWYGLIAEEVAEVEPRLVHWGYSQDDYEFIETQEEVQKERTITSEDGVETVETYTETETKQSKQLKADAQLKPEGVQYDRLTVLLLDIVKRQDKRIEALEAEVAALKAK